MGLTLIFTRFAMVLKLVTNGFDFRKVFLGKWPFQQPSYMLWLFWVLLWPALKMMIDF